MNKINILIYASKNQYRQKLHSVQSSLKRFSSGLDKYANFIIFISLFINIFLPILLILSNTKNIPYIEFVNKELIILLFTINTVSLLNIINSYKNPMLLQYNSKLFILNFLFLKHTSLSSFIFINILCFKLFTAKNIPISLFLGIIILFSITIYILFKYHLIHKKLIKKINNSIIFLLLILAVLKINENFKIAKKINFTTNNTDINNIILIILITYLILRISEMYLKNKQIIPFKNKIILPNTLYTHASYIPILGLFTIHLLKDYTYIANIFIELIFIIFFFNILLQKNKYLNLLSYEGYQSLLFYFKNIKLPFKKVLIEKIIGFVYLIKLDLIIYFLYLTLEGYIKYAILLLLLTCLDVLIGNLLSLIFPTNLQTKNKLEIALYSKYNYSTGIILTLSITTIIQKILSSMEFNSLFLKVDKENIEKIELLITIISISTIIFTLYFLHMWTKSFLKKLYIDKN